MNNGPWGTGIIPGYTNWSSRTGQVTFDPTSTFNPQTYQERYGQQQAPQQPQAPQIDWSSLLGQQPAPQRPASVATGITARPVYTQGQVNGALSKYSGMAPKPAAGPLGGTAANLYNQEAGRASINTGRQMAQDNAAMSLQSSQARSQAGLGWGRLASQQGQLADNQAINQQQMGLALMRALMGGF